MLTRRTILGGASAASLALVGGRKVWAQTTTQLSAVVTLNGQTYTYNESAGHDLGNFVSTIGGFTQRCIRCDVAGSPLTVFFRPDTTSSRIEVVFELGRVWTTTAANLGAYIVKIYNGGTLLATASVPEHYWFSRWRWQSAPRPIVGNVSSLISQGLLPPFHVFGSGSSTSEVCTTAASNPSHPSAETTTCTTVATAATTPTGIMTTYTPYAIMGLAGVEPYMPTTGERDDIGIVTESQAQYICTGATVPLECWRAQAEAAGTVPWHIRDEDTNAPVSFLTYTNASWYSQSVSNPYIPQTTSPITVDSAHQPALAYVPYVMTGDPYHLEDLQFQANWCWGSLPPLYRPSIGQSRAFAWYVRSLAQCARITPASVPSWLLPQSYWMSFLDQNLQFLTANYINNPSPVTSVFRSTGDLADSYDDGPTAPAGCWVDPWQEEFVCSIMGWMIQMGFTDWQTAFDWKVGSTIARTGTTSGWIRACSTPYRMILRSSPTSSTATSWGDAWSLTQQIAQLSYTNPNTWVGTDMTYLGYSRGALVFANLLGAPGITDNLTWATSQIAGNTGWSLPYKWRVGTGI